MTSRQRNRVLLCVSAFLVTIWFLLGSRGVLDHTSKFAVVQQRWVSPRRVAMVASRTDNIALSGNTFFVVIGDHVYSAPELKRARYRLEAVFVTDRDRMNVEWAGENDLTVRCDDCGITKDRIESQRFSDGPIRIHYVGFP
jgi:hypothetical protein